jgi:hypothetical protein
MGRRDGEQRLAATQDLSGLTAQPFRRLAEACARARLKTNGPVCSDKALLLQVHVRALVVHVASAVLVLFVRIVVRPVARLVLCLDVRPQRLRVRDTRDLRAEQQRAMGRGAQVMQAVLLAGCM